MEKSIYTADNARLRKMLRHQREQAGLSQAQLAAKLGVNQTVVSKYERGERRLDVFELRSVCEVLGLDLSEVVDRFVQRPRRRKQT